MSNFHSFLRLFATDHKHLIHKDFLFELKNGQNSRTGRVHLFRPNW